jgi:hypothetical protein
MPIDDALGELKADIAMLCKTNKAQKTKELEKLMQEYIDSPSNTNTGYTKEQLKEICGISEEGIYKIPEPKVRIIGRGKLYNLRNK